MNQPTVIYIILSAILLYLYYKRGDISIFIAFAVVVAGTLFMKKVRENEGFNLGGKGGKGGKKDCAKVGFTETNIDKKKIPESLKKINDNFKKALSKYGTFNENNEFKLNSEIEELAIPIAQDPEVKSILDKEMKENKDLFSYGITVFVLFMNTYNKSDSGEMTLKVFGQEEPVQKTIDDFAKEKDGKNGYKKALSSGESILKTLNEIKNLDVIKKADKKIKEILNFVICAVKHTIVLITKLDKIAGDGDGGGDGEEEKPKKKKKKETKKQKKLEDEEGDANE